MGKVGYAIVSVFLAVSVHAEDVAGGGSDIVIEMHRVDASGVGEAIGTIRAVSTSYGTLFVPDLTGLSPGLHGFHLHQNADCAAAIKNGKPVAALAAGGHYDPQGSGQHRGPYNKDGHLGDLPALYFDAQQRATHPELAPRIKLSDLRGHALVIHEGGDNYADEPKPLGGGGPRVACGVIK